MNQSKRDGFTSLLITGEPRSGTTLLANFLNSQDAGVVYADLMKSWFGEPRRLRLRSLCQQLSDRQKNVLLSSLIAEGWKFGLSNFDGIERSSFDTWFGLYHQALSALDPDGGAQVIGTKVTRQYDYLRELLDSGVRVIFCVRDPRDVLLSAKNRFSNYNMYDTALKWRRGIQIANCYCKHEGCFILRFEDLIAQRDKIVRELGQFLNLPLDPAVQSLQIRDGTRFVSNTSFGDIKEPFDDQALYRWKESKATCEVIFSSRFLDKEIGELGYSPLTVNNSQYRILYRNYLFYSLKSWLRSLVRRALYILL